MTTNHTPTPWHINADDKTAIFNSMGGYVTRIDGNAVQTRAAIEGNAAFIVEACNSRATNLARIAELEAALRKLTIAAANVCVQTDGIGVINKVAELRPLIPEMRAALARREQRAKG